MSFNKPRPRIDNPNWPGNNGLRGGVKEYSTKTVIGIFYSLSNSYNCTHKKIIIIKGNWQDALGGPGFYNRGFSTVEFETEGQHQQKGYLQQENFVSYGAGLPKMETLKVEKPTTFDIFAPYKTASDAWKSTSHVDLQGGLEKKPDIIANKNISREDLERYRNEWTSDTPTSRTFRFNVESKIAGNAMKNFETATVRMLPGTPRALETYREKLIERYGVLALSCIRYQIFNGTKVGFISVDNFKAAITNSQVKIIHPDMMQIIAYFTPFDKMNAEQFVRIIVGRVDGFNASEVKGLYAKLGGSLTPVAIDDIADKLCYDTHPEVVEGVKNYLTAYCRTVADYITEDDFVLLHSDIYSSSPANYSAVLSTVWSV